MEVFRDLLVTATPEQMAAVVAAIESSQSTGWVVDRESAEQSRKFNPPGRSALAYHFRHTANGALPAALLALVQDENDGTRFTVPNIIPTDSPQLSRAVYNRLLEDFAQRVIQPAAAAVGVKYELTDPHAELTRWMSPDTAEKLVRFSHDANRESGAARPEDRALWNAFVLAASREQCRLDAATLTRWLTEVEGWPQVWAERLALEYHYGRELLGFSSSHRGI
jgi:hypothetical protein